jgi:proline dehydrogenase
LGVASSSRRYKEDIEPLGDVSERLYSLRPVKFRYIKPDEQGQKAAAVRFSG